MKVYNIYIINCVVNDHCGIQELHNFFINLFPYFQNMEVRSNRALVVPFYDGETEPHSEALAELTLVSETC